MYGTLATIAAIPLAAETAAAPSQDWITYLLQGGPFAILVILFLLDKVAPTGERNELRKEKEEFKADIKDLNNQLIQVIPQMKEIADNYRQLADRALDVVEDKRYRPRGGGRE